MCRRHVVVDPHPNVFKRTLRACNALTVCKQTVRVSAPRGRPPWIGGSAAGGDGARARWRGMRWRRPSPRARGRGGSVKFKAKPKGAGALWAGFKGNGVAPAVGAADAGCVEMKPTGRAAEQRAVSQSRASNRLEARGGQQKPGLQHARAPASQVRGGAAGWRAIKARKGKGGGQRNCLGGGSAGRVRWPLKACMTVEYV